MTDFFSPNGAYLCQATLLPFLLLLLLERGTGMLLWELTSMSGLFCVLAPTHSL